MFLFVFLILFNSTSFADDSTLPVNLKGVQDGQQIYLDAEKTSVFNEPGFNYLSCQENPETCKALAWPTRDSQVFYRGYSRIDNAETLQRTYEDQSYIYVRVPVWDSKENKWKDVYGWTNGDQFKLRPYESAFKKGPTDFKPKNKCDSPKINKLLIEHFNKESNESMDGLIKSISPFMGVCPTGDPQIVRTKFAKNEVPYDELVLPMMRKMDFPKVEIVEGRKTHQATQEDFIAIDANARSCFAEMGTCALDGPEYIFAWERIVLNRQEYAKENKDKKNRFEHDNRMPSSDLTKIATEPDQYTIWKNKNGTGHALCPPSNPDKNFYDPKVRRNPLPPELAMWNMCLRVATEGVLFPEYFKQVRTPHFNELFYVVGSKVTEGFESVTNVPDVLGRPISNQRCMHVLRDPSLTPLKK